jgi:hypothetical protein
MIRKLAEEIAGNVGGDSPIVPGKNDIRPQEPAAPAVKPDLQGPWTDTTAQRAADTKQGELGRAFGEFSKSVGDYKHTIGSVLDAKIEEISGSSAASQAVARNRG